MGTQTQKPATKFGTHNNHMRTRIKEIQHGLALIALVPLFVIGSGEMLSGLRIGTWRIFNVLDFLIMAPFWMFTLLRLHGPITKNSKIWQRWISLLLITSFLYGHAVHLTADTIHTYMTHSNDYTALVPDDFHKLIDFLDEDVGHWMQFIPLFLLLGSWISFNDVNLCDRQLFAFPFASNWFTFSMGIIMGMSVSFSTIEGGCVFLGILGAAFLSLATCLKALTHREKNLKWRDDLLIQFGSGFIFGTFIGLYSYWFFVGDLLLQPSVIFNLKSILQLEYFFNLKNRFQLEI
eukprot:TRINITY_DN10370_c0_g2_i1.p1 TRINITY_DN10370_c0_g2~~TRINITY_DN10370_c0_g2_i1.p1  ORF type:complete len:292 (-),score=75.94 TRINITY_DN10370_c0_g2_i1:140-1015(-)